MRYFIFRDSDLAEPANTIDIGYSYRHQFATDMLKGGCDVDSLAQMMGNSAMVIRQHYSHLLADAQVLRSKLERFRTGEVGTRTPPPPADAAGAS